MKLSECADVSRVTVQPPQVDASLSRWDRLLNCNNDKQVWAAIDWQGMLDESNPCEKSCPSDDQFKEFFDEALRSDDQTPFDSITLNVYIPVLDNPILEPELSEEVSDLNSDKAAGSDGVQPGIIRLLPPSWIVFITFLLNNMFLSSFYPQS